MLRTLLADVAPGGRGALLRSRRPVDVMHLASDNDLRPLVDDDLVA